MNISPAEFAAGSQPKQTSINRRRGGGQVESAGKSRQRVKGASPYIVKDSDQLWSPSHASATRKGAAKR